MDKNPTSTQNLMALIEGVLRARGPDARTTVDILDQSEGSHRGMERETTITITIRTP